jgi:hypothetical protein
MEAIVGRRSWLAALFVAMASERAYACSCIDPPRFWRAATEADAVLIVRVVASYTPSVACRPYFDAKVLRTVRGSEKRSVVRVWGGCGPDCGCPLRPFVPGKTWALALWHPRTNGREEPWSPSDYRLGVCGEYAREVSATVTPEAIDVLLQENGSEDSGEPVVTCGVPLPPREERKQQR